MTDPSGPRLRLRYEPTASESPTGKARQQAYYLALGRFVDMFAKVENAIAQSLWHYAETPFHMGRALFPHVGVADAMGLIKRVFEVTKASDEAFAALADLFDQLSTISTVRNKILHHGAISVPEGNAAVTDALKAISQDKIKSFAISPAALDDATTDLTKIFIHLTIDHMGRPELLGLHPHLNEIMGAPWKYIHVSLSQSGTSKAPRRPRAQKTPSKPKGTQLNGESN